MKAMDHVAYPKMLKSKSDSQLRFAIRDCMEAMRSNPEGKNNDYYADEICYCAAELNLRKKGQ